MKTNNPIELVSFGDLAKQLSTNGRALHVSTIHRWARRGVRGVRLRATRVGGRWFVEPQAFRDFIAALTGNGVGHVGYDLESTPSSNSSAAEQTLDSLGW
jgi:hypothetical protein